MEKKRSLYTERKRNEKQKAEKKIASGDSSSSHTVVLVKGRDGKFVKQTTKKPVSHNSSVPSSCLSEAEKLKKLPKKLPSEPDMKSDVKLEGCLHAGWEIASKLEFLVRDTAGRKQVNRIESHIEDLAEISKCGYRVDVLNSLCVILDFLVEEVSKTQKFRDQLILLLVNADKPILLTRSSDVGQYFETVRHYLLYLGYLLIRLEDDDLFDMVFRALIWQLTVPNSARAHGMKLGYTLAAASPVLYQTAARMLAVASAHRFPMFLHLAFILACNSKDICVEMIKENILENVLTRFNPSYPDPLPDFENKIFDRHDADVPRVKKFCESSIHMSTTLSLLLVLLNTLSNYLEEIPKNRNVIPTPNPYAQRCLIYAYRCECHARRRHECAALTVIAHVLLDCYGDRLSAFSNTLMPDIISLSVLSEIPPRSDWTQTVKFYGVQADVYFKKLLLYFSVDLLKVYTYNDYMVESRHWLQGLVNVLDPNLKSSQVSWPTLLYEELRKVALQVLICVLPHLPHNLTKNYTSIVTQRMMCQIEEYNKTPYEISNLYWCTRLLQVSSYMTQDNPSPEADKLLDESLISLCKTLLKQRHPPMKRNLVIVSLCLRILARIFVSESTDKPTDRLESIYSFALAMLDTILALLENHFLISDRWLISTLALIWEAIKVSPSYSDMFVASSGVYKLLDIVTLRKPNVQCVCLAMLCDIAVDGRGVAQLTTWRAKPCVADVSPNLVRSGATIMTLLASIFRDECLATGVKLSVDGVIRDLHNPLQSNLAKESLKELERERRDQHFVTAADLCGSRLPKVYCLLHLLSEDLEFKVSIADEAYKLYKNIHVSPQDEVILVLCSHYLTLKLNETWSEMAARSPELVPQDQKILEEFLQLNGAWGKEIRNQQNKVLQRDQENASKEEASLYSFLRRVRLHDALDAVLEARCIARTSDQTCLTYAMIQKTVHALVRTSVAEAEMRDKVIRTYTPPLDERNMNGHYVRVQTTDCICELCRCKKEKKK
ncbi:uncharacterized protein LOC121738761 [Aricia agestis]|uniref:uncharacterized protein LOC121738761 n=1 Tax=Aricia agestis TaxID=91739 RepID=UPI001C2046AE|nr:uncharacterized protein LOC121738761 [Aricia agestis]